MRLFVRERYGGMLAEKLGIGFVSRFGGKLENDIDIVYTNFVGKPPLFIP